MARSLIEGVNRQFKPSNLVKSFFFFFFGMDSQAYLLVSTEVLEVSDLATQFAASRRTLQVSFVLLFCRDEK